jgi:type I restriction enzyme S subunit
VSNLISYSIGGGWGKENPQGDFQSKVAVIRGADFPSIEQGAYDRLPIRWEKKTKASKASLQPGDIVLEISGGTDERPTGRTLFITDELIDSYDCPVIPASFCRLLRPEHEINSAYLFFWLQDMYEKGRTWGYQNRSTGLSNFQYKVFSELEQVTVPETETQNKISSLLLTIENKRRLNNRTNDYLFECCMAKMNDLVGPSDSTMKVGDCCESIYSGGTPSTKKPAYWDGNLPWLSSGETRSRFIIDTKKTITELGVAESSTKLAKAGDVVMASAGQGFTRGQTSMLFFDTYVNQSVVVIRPKQDYGAYLLLMLAAQYDNLRAWSDSTSTRGSMSGKLLRQFELPHFDADQAKELMSFAEPMFAMIENNMRESKALAQARDALLPKLTSGEIDVSEVELPTQPNNHLSVD